MLLKSWFCLVFIFLPMFLPNASYSLTNQELQDNKALKLGETMIKQVGKNEKNVYLINANANELFQILIQRKDISLSTKILSPAKNVEFISDVSNSNYLEEVFLLAKEKGVYQIELGSNDYGSSVSELSITVKVLIVSEEEKKAYSCAEQIASKISQVMSTGDLKIQREFLEDLDKALLIWEKYNQLNKQIDLLVCMGQIYFFLGETDKAKDSFNKGLSISLLLSNIQEQAILLNNLATAHYKSGEMDKAVEFYQQALKITNDKKSKLSILSNIAAINSLLGNKQEALEGFNSSLIVAKELFDEPKEANITMNIAITYSYIGEYKKTLDYCEKALVLATKIGDLGIQQTCSNVMALSFAGLGDYEKAFEFYEKAFNLAKTLSNKERQCESLLGIGELHVKFGETQRALNSFEQAVLFAEESKFDFQKAKAFIALGNIYNRLQKTDKAINLFNESLSISRKFKNKKLERAVLEGLGQANDKDLSKALEYYESALKLIGDNNDPAAISILNNIAIIGKFHK